MAAVPLLQQSENGDGPMPKNNADDAVSIEDLDIVVGREIFGSQAVEASSVHRWAAKLVVNCYRVAGLGMLALILLGLVSYLALVVFYALDSTWISPQIISRSDERVLHLKAELTQAELQYEKLATERVGEAPGMGRLFKALAVAPQGAPLLPGFVREGSQP